MQEPTKTPPRRKRFQIHLSTAIVMMFVAGGLMWANTRNQITENYLRTWTVHGLTANGYGWPYMVYIEVEELDSLIRLEERRSTKFVYRRAIINSLVALTILVATWFLCEWLIRRRAAPKGA